jgi:ATP-dependent Clp protease ATP-binding subunit ClpB
MNDSERQAAVLDALRAQFRPEFLNRIDETIIFNSLKEEQINGIVKVQLELVVQRLKAKKINIEFDDKAVQFLARKGFDPVYGARPLKRAIQSELLNPLSKEIIAGKIKSGDTVKVKMGDQKLDIG